MKSFVEYPLDFEKLLFPESSRKNCSGKLIAHYDLYRKISHLEGSVVKCGIAAEEGFIQFALLRNLIASQPDQKVIAFERFTKTLHVHADVEEKGEIHSKIERYPINIERIDKKLAKHGMTEKIEFIPGNIGDTIPEYLIENPELKISFLNVDFDDYNSAFTTLQFFYPRIIHGGIVIFDNYYKKEEDYDAVKDYFKYLNPKIHNFSVNNGPHYLVRL